MVTVAPKRGLMADSETGVSGRRPENCLRRTTWGACRQIDQPGKGIESVVDIEGLEIGGRALTDVEGRVSAAVVEDEAEGLAIVLVEAEEPDLQIVHLVVGGEAGLAPDIGGAPVFGGGDGNVVGSAGVVSAVVVVEGSHARVAIRIPYDYARHLQDGTTASVQVLVDGSDSTVAGMAVSTSTGVALEQSLVRVLPNGNMPIEVRPSLLYNPAMRSANFFFVPGLIAVLLQVMCILLIALSLVRERERGTLEQLTMTPVAPLGLMVGKMIPYGVLAFFELCAILAAMRIVFQVPVHGSTILLLLLSLPYILTLLGLGLVISTKAKTQAEAFQLALGTTLPSVFLSGYIFMIENMPLFFQGISRLIPATYFIRILRGIILRGSSSEPLAQDAAILTVMGCLAILLAARLFVTQRA